MFQPHELLTVIRQEKTAVRRDAVKRAILGGHLKSSATFWSPMVKGTCFLSMKYKHNLERHQNQVFKDLPLVLPLLAFEHVF